MNQLQSFTEFFRALWGRHPFPWQSMLAERVAGDTRPNALNLPTTSGRRRMVVHRVYARYGLRQRAFRPATDHGISTLGQPHGHD